MSLFTYGSGQSTATFTDLTFPHNIVTIHDLSPDQIASAGAQCQSAGVLPGPAFTSCELDVALTADATFVAAAAEQRVVGVDPTAAALDANGNLHVDFESTTLPDSIRPSRLGTDTATTSFAGPFSGLDTYRFYVQPLPPHLFGSLSFDLLTIGDWTSGTDTRTVTVQTDRANPYTITPTSLTPVTTGTLSTGLPYAAYRVTMPFNHTSSQVEFTISASGVGGLGGQAFGVDNVDLHMDLVPAQTFTGSLPLSVSNGVPAAGAGNLETAVSEDDYTFDLSSASGIYVHAHNCAHSNLGWALLDSKGTRVAYGYSCQDGEGHNLPAGTYRLRTDTQNGAAVGAYALDVTAIPADAAQTMTVDGSSVTATTTGAGQNVSMSFAGTAGQRVSVQLSGGTFSSATARLYRPDGTQLAALGCSTSCLFDAVTLPSTGTYTVFVDPWGTATGSIIAKVWSVPADATYTMTVDGPSVTAATTVAGQNASVSFAGTAGQKVSVQVSGGTFASAIARLYAPDGTQIDYWGCPTSCLFDAVTLPAFPLVTDTLFLGLGPVVGRLGLLPRGGVVGDLPVAVDLGHGGAVLAGLRDRLVPAQFPLPVTVAEFLAGAVDDPGALASQLFGRGPHLLAPLLLAADLGDQLGRGPVVPVLPAQLVCGEHDELVAAGLLDVRQGALDLQRLLRPVVRVLVVTVGVLAGLQLGQHRGGQLQQLQPLGHVALGVAGPGGDLVLLAAGGFLLGERAGLFHRGQRLAGGVLADHGVQLGQRVVGAWQRVQLSRLGRRVPVTVVRGRRPAREWPVSVWPSMTTSKSRLRRIGRVTDCRQVTRGPSQTMAASGTVSDFVDAVPASTPPGSVKT